MKQQATKALNAANELSITSNEEMVKATDLLSKMKTVARMIKERKEEITKPLTEALNSARDLFKPIESNLADAEKVVKTKMLSWQDEEDKRIEAAKAKVMDKVEDGKMSAEKASGKIEQIGEVQTSVRGKVGSVSTKIIKKYRVTDETKIPREFLTPDMVKITEALKAGQAVPGAEMYEEKTISAR